MTTTTIDNLIAAFALAMIVVPIIALAIQDARRYSWRPRMTESAATSFVREELEMTLDDDYPDKEEWLIDELMENGFSEEKAEKLVSGM